MSGGAGGGGSQVMTSTAGTASINTNTEPSHSAFAIPEASQPQASQIHSMRLSYQQQADASASAYKQPTNTNTVQGINVNNNTSGMAEHHHHDPAAAPPPPPPLKKKRGRPRKYAPDGSMPMPLPPPVSAPPPHLLPVPGTHPLSQPVIPVQTMTLAPQQPVSPMAEGVPSLSPTSLKRRGRPPGSGKKQHLDALGSAGFGFTPHVITVKAGEDVSSKIMGFSQHGPRAVCILSANGSIANVTLRQPATSGGTVTYQGRFEILSLSGSYLPSNDGGQRSRTGGLSVSLSGPDGRVLGGSVAGLLVAATPVQVVVGSFVADGRKDLKPVNHVEPLSATMKLTSTGGSTGGSSPQSRGALSESSGGPGSPLNQISSACNNSNPQIISGISWK